MFIDVYFQEEWHFSLIGYIKLIGHFADCSFISKKEVRSGKHTHTHTHTEISITFTAASEGEQNQ